MFYWLLKYTVGPLVRLIWVKKIEGIENIPKNGPVIFAANHSSYFDFITMIAVCPRRVTFLTAEVFYKNKFWRPLVVLTGQVKVDRKASDKSFVYAAARSILAGGGVFGIFPEGTRSRSGKMQKAYSGVAKIAHENGVGIVPVAISGTYDVMSPHDKYPRFKKIITINFLPQIVVGNKQAPEILVHKKLMPLLARTIGQTYDY